MGIVEELLVVTRIFLEIASIVCNLFYSLHLIYLHVVYEMHQLIADYFQVITWSFFNDRVCIIVERKFGSSQFLTR